VSITDTTGGTITLAGAVADQSAGILLQSMHSAVSFQQGATLTGSGGTLTLTNITTRALCRWPRSPPAQKASTSTTWPSP